MSMMRSVIACGVLATSAILAAPDSQAEGWKHEFAPYLWGAAMEGEAGIGPVAADVDISFGDILENLEMGFMGLYRGTRGPWSISVDGIYMGLGANATGPNGLLTADVDVDQSAIEVDLGYALSENFSLLLGARYNDLSMRVRTFGALGNVLRSREADESWIDPVIGAQLRVPLSASWSFNLRGDIGGLDVGSFFAWQGLASLRWQATPRFSLVAAYRHIEMDYEDGSGDGAFVYDMAMSGPALGFAFTF
jgi:hypothetical protein